MLDGKGEVTFNKKKLLIFAVKQMNEETFSWFDQSSSGHRLCFKAEAFEA